MGNQNLFQLAGICLAEPGIDNKVEYSNTIIELFNDNKLNFQSQQRANQCPEPGWPEKPELVSPASLPKRNLRTKNGKATMIHALAHIEFNAINIAWDAIYRFRDMPDEYYSDWIKIAGEETKHFSLLRALLQQKDHEYGDFPAHNGLWRVVKKTAYDVLARMAIVPRVYEARGLDVSPDIIHRFKEAGDDDICQVMQLIYKDEIGHVAVGNRWFQYLCKQRKLEPMLTFIELVKEHMDTMPRIKLNREARLLAGFSNKEMEIMEREFS